MKTGRTDPYCMEDWIHRIVPLYGGLGRPKDQDAASLCPLKNAEVGELWSVF